MSIFDKIFGTYSDRELKRIRPIADKVMALEDDMAKLSDAELKAKTPEFKERLKNGETLDDLLPEAFAVMREASWRVLGMKHFYVQVIGGIILHQGRIAEMRTGEGKTLVCTLPAYLNALEEKGVLVVTVNDYLAKRDAEWMGQVHNFLGLSVGIVLHDMKDDERRAAYASDITYVVYTRIHGLSPKAAKNAISLSEAEGVFVVFKNCNTSLEGTVSYDEQSNELKLNIPFIVKNVAIFYGDEDCEGEIRVENADGLTLNLESFSEDEIQFVFWKKPSAKEYNIKFQYVVIVGSVRLELVQKNLRLILQYHKSFWIRFKKRSNDKITRRKTSLTIVTAFIGGFDQSYKGSIYVDDTVVSTVKH